MSRWLSFAHGRISREEFEKELRSYTENENDILPFPNSDFITFKPPYQSEWTSEDKMKDWLDTDEFKKCVNRLHDFDAGQKLSVIPLEMLKEKIRERFLPKNKDTYDRICDYMESADYGLEEVDFDKLRLLVWGKE